MVYHSPTLDSTFAALADPTRREILARLSKGEETISELASRFDMSLPAVSKHVHVLQAAGLAKIAKEGRVRRATLTPKPMQSAMKWIEYYREYWESELDALARYLEQPSATEQSWQPKPQQPRRASRFAASSRHRANVSSRRGRRRKN
ncbi:MAG TPA: metalloregulator ArsR/SmtB family transcription factor [Gemmatimonadaceae bacterium]|nr:metalloregulator ArsR/SmtB family transcription factor [Gemmatimonadaceae bacterium]